MGLSIKVTSECEKQCSWCPVLPWMNTNPGYHLQIKDIEDLIRFSKESGYHWQFIMFSGGEPMHWEHIVEAAQILRRSGICDELISYTNAMIADTDLQRVIDVARFATSIKVSIYDYNRCQVQKVLKAVPKAKAINRLYFYKIPPEKVENALPADCTCSAYGMIGNRVTLCSFMEFMVAYQGWDINDFKNESVDLQPNFLDKLKEKNPFMQDACCYCFGNSKVQAVAEKTPNKAFVRWTTKS